MQRRAGKQAAWVSWRPHPRFTGCLVLRLSRACPLANGFVLCALCFVPLFRFVVFRFLSGSCFAMSILSTATPPSTSNAPRRDPCQFGLRLVALVTSMRPPTTGSRLAEFTRNRRRRQLAASVALARHFRSQNVSLSTRRTHTLFFRVSAARLARLQLAFGARPRCRYRCTSAQLRALPLK